MVVPDPSLMMKIGRTGYSLSEILAEFIDNSIDARVGESVEVEIGLDESRVSVEDNGRGMSKEELVSALTIASSAKKDALGEYGIGMKAAAVALANEFVIETTREDDDHGYKVTWDAKEWVQRGEWSYEVQTRKAAKSVHGTSILLTGLRFVPGKRIGVVKNELGRRFGPFIRNGELKLTVNGSKCRAPDPELLPATALSPEIQVALPKREKLARQEFTLQTHAGKTITGWVGLLANSSQKGLYGFDTFRRGRLITYNDKFGFNAHPMVARVVGEVHMDFVGVTSNKREWMKTDPLYEDAEETLKEFIQPWLAECRRLSSTVHNVKPVELAKLDKFKEGLALAFQSPELADFTGPVGGDRGHGRKLEEVPIEERGERSDVGGEHEPRDVIQEPESSRDRQPRKTDPNRTKRLKVGGKHFDYEHQFGNLGPTAPWMQFDWQPQSRKLTVISNQDSPIFAVTRDVSVLAFMHVVDAVAQVVITETQADFSRYDEVRQVLIREASRHVAEL